MRHFAVLALTLSLIIPGMKARADDSQAAAFKSIITHQLESFAKNDGAAAYSDAAPFIQQAFPSVEIFMTMVKTGYMPVYQNKSYAFTETGTDNAGRPTQRVRIQGVDGKDYEALYTMQQQPDGSWRIAGCTLREIPSVNA